MDLTGWLDYFVEGLATQMNEVRQRGELVIRRDVIARKHGLNERQAQVVEVLLGLNSVAIEDAEAALPGIPRRTLQRDLQVLVEKRIAVAEGAARARRYCLQDKRLR